MQRVFFDSEFTELGVDPKLISIGFVAEDGERTFYAELADTYRLSDCSDFAKLAVLPLLEGGNTLMTMRELGERLTSWLTAFGEPVKLATDSLSWDWPWIKEIFYEMDAWPKNLDGYLVGERGKGLACMFKMMNEARIAVGLGAAVLGYTSYLHALDYALNRPQGRLAAEKDPARPQVPIVEHADVRRMLLAQKSYSEGALALALYSARLVDEQQSAPTDEERLRAERLLDLLTPMTKSWPSQWCLEGNSLAIQIHGGYGYTREYNVEQFYRDNRLNPIHEGTFGIQALDLLGRKIRLHDGQSMELLDARIQETTNIARARGLLREHAEQLSASWAAVLQVVQRLYSIAEVSIRLANAGAFLEAFGHVVLAWIWLEQAIAATKLLEECSDESERNFSLGKLQACRFFYFWELPKVSTWLLLLDPVEITCLEMKNEWF